VTQPTPPLVMVPTTPGSGVAPEAVDGAVRDALGGARTAPAHRFDAAADLLRAAQ